uniref:Uncharacterized protein n=1 Tax=Anthurium amnicola TaxID=1678845 RepID=A0A1D1YKX9_9ARAE
MVVVTISTLDMPALSAVMRPRGRRLVSLLRGGLVVSEARLLPQLPKQRRVLNPIFTGLQISIWVYCRLSEFQDFTGILVSWFLRLCFNLIGLSVQLYALLVLRSVML